MKEIIKYESDDGELYKTEIETLDADAKYWKKQAIGGQRIQLTQTALAGWRAET